MRKSAFRTLSAAALLGMSSLVFAQANPAQHAMPPGHMMMQQAPQAMGAAPASPGSRELHQSMMSGMQDMQRRPLQGDVDTDFIRMMRQHHLQGIEMARIELQRGDDAEAKRMAQKIIDNQQKEVAEMSSWLQRHQ
jgi:uncharacterized protein (DUF305 family)